MKKLLFLLLPFIYSNLSAQGIECNMKGKGKPFIFTEQQIDSLRLTNAINAPYTVKIFVTVFANDDGSNRGAPNADILRQVQNMANQYQPQNICFILGGIRQVNNSDLNNHNADTEEADLNPFKVSGFLNIFIHDGLPGLNGTAYAIPNTYLSLWGGAVTATDNISTMGHELGHCLGLYHTFEPWTDENGNPTNQENVARSGGCKNCTTAGDVICDTPADDNGGVNSSCVYTGGGQDACNVTYTPMTTNMMGYGFRPCRSQFTNGQGERMRSFLTTNGSLTPLVAQDELTFPVLVSLTISSGTGYLLARDLVTVSDGNYDLTVNGTANYQIQSKKVSLKPGTRFAPASGGRVNVKVNSYCD